MDLSGEATSDSDNGEDGVLIAKNAAGASSGVANYPPPAKSKSKGSSKKTKTNATVHASASINDHGSSIAAQSSLDSSSSSRKSKSVSFAKKTSSSSASGGSGGRGITPASTLPLPSGEADRDRVSSISFLLHAQENRDPLHDEFAPPPKRAGCIQRHTQALACLCIVLLLGVGFMAHIRWNIGPDSSVRSYFNASSSGSITTAAQSNEASDASAAKSLLHSHRLASAADRFEDDDLPPLPHFSPPPRRLRPDDADALAITDVDLPRDRSDILHRPLHGHAPVPRHVKGPHLPTAAELDAQARELLKGGGMGLDDELHLGTLDDSSSSSSVRTKHADAINTAVGLRGSGNDELDVEAELHHVEAQAAAEVAAERSSHPVPHPRADDISRMHHDVSSLPKIHLDINEAFKAHASHPKHTAQAIAKAHEQFVTHPPELDAPHPRLPSFAAHHPRFVARSRRAGTAASAHAPRHGYDAPRMVFDSTLKAKEVDDDDDDALATKPAPGEQEDHPFEPSTASGDDAESQTMFSEMQARFPLDVSALPPHSLFPFGALASLASTSLVQATISPRGLFPYCLACERRCAHVVKAVEFFARNQQHHSALAATTMDTSATTSKLRALGSNLSAFHRATAHLGHEDFHHLAASHALRSKWSHPTSTLTTLAGDLHLGNFGVYSARTYHANLKGFIAESSPQALVFDLNDFDASGVVSEQYWRDVVRLGSSVVFTMRQHPAINDEGERRTYGQDQISTILQTMLKGYHDSIAAIAAAATEGGASSHASLSSHSLTLATLPSDSPLIPLLEKTAHKRSRVAMLDRFAPRTPDGSRRHFAIGSAGTKLGACEPHEEKEIKAAWERMQQSLGIFARETMEEHRPHTAETHDAAAAASAAPHTFPPWVPLSARQVSGPFMDAHILSARSSYFRIKSLTRRVSGLASLGARRYYVLIEGPSASLDDDVILDVKQESEAEWLHFVDGRALHRNAFVGSAGARVARSIHALLPGLMHPSTTTPHASFATPDPHTAFVELHTATAALPGASAAPARHSSDSFVVRERSPWKRKLNPRKVLRSHGDWLSLGGSVGAALAAAHCRADAHYDARFVPGYFARGFLRAVPLDQRALWTQDLEAAVWAEVARREGDYACWIEHAQNQPWSKTTTKDSDDDDDDDGDEE